MCLRSVFRLPTIMGVSRPGLHAISSVVKVSNCSLQMSNHHDAMISHFTICSLHILNNYKEYCDEWRLN